MSSDLISSSNLFFFNHTLTFIFGITTGVTIFTILRTLQDFKATSQQSTNNAVKTVADQDAEYIKKRIEADFTISRETLLRVTKHIVMEMKRGLHSDGQTLKMIPSFVTNLPKGTETGSYLALDLGGSNFRVCEILLSTDGTRVRCRQKKFIVSEELKKGTSEMLFDFFADAVDIFIREVLGESTSDFNAEYKKLGFTFSFPIKQTALNQGTLMVWTKGFTTSGVVGKDVVNLLQEAFHRKNLRITAAALVNDTVGTLISHAYSDPQTNAGVILGTGTNAAYVERIENIPKWTGGPVASGKMVINTEWGAFDEDHIVIPLTKFDKKLDRASNNPGKQTFEKMISGLYLGEISRYALVDLMKTGFIFKTKNLEDSLLSKPYHFETAYMSRIERDHSKDLSDINALLGDVFKIFDSTLEERSVVKRVCELVGLRAARLSAAGIAALVTKMNKLDGCTVAIDGSVFEHYPHFGNRMRDALFELLGISAENIDFAQARDGSGQGAALIAALADNV
ncbi:hexokinase A [Clydaea vesicula]|uniref:Phosphotransferase n=1 Tax=Clydaea vesicula TaxID=447962 RepID=A0AAD5XZX4_9FUNG|nr:hexokinase A [Clydaea vesicula]KAJ3386650.1 hexokinase A [Lobulomyces angularis]